MTESAGKPKLLSGGNPQIPKGTGDAVVQSYIAAMPGWKQDIGRRLDTQITRLIPKVEKAVKWNSPFYGMEQGRWFLSFHCMTKYIKVTFFDGAALDPPPKFTSKYPQIRYAHIFEGDAFEDDFANWIPQAAALPGERM